MGFFNLYSTKIVDENSKSMVYNDEIRVLTYQRGRIPDLRELNAGVRYSKRGPEWRTLLKQFMLSVSGQRKTH